MYWLGDGYMVTEDEAAASVGALGINMWKWLEVEQPIELLK